MYHIQEDKRAQKSAELILDAVQRCMREKPYEQITISDICRMSTVSRATFYRLFDKKDDVIFLGMDRFLTQFCTTLEGRGIRERLESYFAAWMMNPDMLDLIVIIHREDIPYECYRKRVGLLEQYFTRRAMSDHHIMVLSSIITSLLTNWAQSGKKETPAELVQIFLKVIGDLSACFASPEGME